MTRHPSCLGFFGCLALTMMTACGTQIGVEDNLECRVDTTTVLTDLTVVQPEMSASPRDVIDGLVGTFEGDNLDEDEAPIGGSATLEVSDAEAEVSYLTYEVVDNRPTSGGDVVSDVGIHCPPRYEFDLEISLEADDLPSFEDTVSFYYVNDNAGARINDTSGFDASLPAPTAFVPGDFDVVEPELFLSGIADNWGIGLTWLAYNPDEAEPDGDQPMTTELLLNAKMTRVTE